MLGEQWERAVCACGWRGVPTFLGGLKTGKVRMTRIGPAFEVVGSQRQATCPVCKEHYA